ncbi:hypothetical protein RvY_05826 [Ramazzottius varieornatus]|uniref:Ribosomal protein S9 n=1 Tax=Ramazzottius varieornatus TaxID=947166 RepID=A0A1D1UWE3_RAMVA|nr:hypothetical protein RvY_05826 [Ramazzottius varieornatus]
MSELAKGVRWTTSHLRLLLDQATRYAGPSRTSWKGYRGVSSVSGSPRMSSNSPSDANAPRKLSGAAVSEFVKNAHLNEADPKVKVNRAMRSYLERAQAHNMFMKQQQQDFEICRRHLANMMGEDVETFSQEDIDDSIRYLLPSNLFSRRSRPLMKPPQEVFPQEKEAQFGIDGRPFRSLFYTGLPNYYQVLYDAANWTRQLDDLEDERVRKGKVPPEKQIDLTGTAWKSKDEMSKMLLEKISDHDYRRFVLTMERLLRHPYAYRVEEFIKKYRQVLIAETKDLAPPVPKKDDSGKSYAESHATKKSCHAWVTLKQGTGKYDINGQDLLFFPRVQDRTQVMFPLQFLNKLYDFDVIARAEFGGNSSKAQAIREGISRCLTAFVTSEELELMRQAGLLTHDKRVKERKKYAYTGARSKPQWRKR